MHSADHCHKSSGSRSPGFHIRLASPAAHQLDRMATRISASSSNRGAVNVPVLLLLLVWTSLAVVTTVQGQLSRNFYQPTCKNAVNVVSAAVTSALNRRPAAAAGILRMQFHDCFVHGCDASVLIDSPSEKDARPNQGLQGFEVIDAAKTAVERQCPGVVSCADILALATELSVRRLSGGRITYPVTLGRRDGLVSSAADVTGKLPGPTASVASLKTIFGAVGMSTKDMVVLSGAHSVGRARCGAIQNRLTTPPDATLDPAFASFLKSRCPAGSLNSVNLDVTTPNRLDEIYYKNLRANKGLLTSDQNLQTDPETQAMIADNTVFGTFRNNFADAMRRMGDIGVLTGTAGQIRINCRKFN